MKSPKILFKKLEQMDIYLSRKSGDFMIVLLIIWLLVAVPTVAIILWWIVG